MPATCGDHLILWTLDAKGRQQVELRGRETGTVLDRYGRTVPDGEIEDLVCDGGTYGVVFDIAGRAACGWTSSPSRSTRSSYDSLERLAEVVALVLHAEGLVDLVRLLALVAGLQRERPAAALARQALGLLEQRAAGAPAAGGARSTIRSGIQASGVARFRRGRKCSEQQARCSPLVVLDHQRARRPAPATWASNTRAALRPRVLGDPVAPEDLEQLGDPLEVVLGRARRTFTGRPCSSAPLIWASTAFSRASASASGEPKRRPGRASGPWWPRMQCTSASSRSRGNPPAAAAARAIDDLLAERHVAEHARPRRSGAISAPNVELPRLAHVVQDRRGHQQVRVQPRVQHARLEPSVATATVCSISPPR